MARVEKAARIADVVAVRVGFVILSAYVAVAGCGSAQPSDRASSKRAPGAPSSVATAPPPSSAAPLPLSNDPRAPRLGWPLPDDCTSPARCKLANGELGLTCEDGGACMNPCPSGRAPNAQGTSCERPCKVDSECPGGSCTEEGLCDFIPALPCSHRRDCPLPDGHLGAQCMKSDPCINPCKPGLFQAKNGDCAKACTTSADCPGGTCDDGFCGPTCPSKACPYPWE